MSLLSQSADEIVKNKKIMLFFTLFFLFFSYLASHFAAHLNTESQKLSHQLARTELSPFLDRSANTAELAKQKNKFWVRIEDVDKEGAALDVLSSDMLFKSAFPGYPKSMANDKELWSIYFDQKFTSFIYLNYFKNVIPDGMGMSYSFTGCLEVIKRYGVDVLIIGNSETYRAIQPDLLYKKLSEGKSKSLENLKILSCPVGDMTVNTAIELTKAIAQMKNKKIPLVLWGYSFWSAFPNGNFLQGQTLVQKKQIEDYFNPKPFYLKKWDKLKKYLSGWDAVIPFNVESLEGVIKKNKFSNQQSCTAVPEKYLNSLEKLSKYIAEEFTVSTNVHFEGVGEGDCQLTQSEKDLGTVVENLKVIANKSYIFITPITPTALKRTPACFLPSLQGLLNKFKSESVYVDTKDWLGSTLNLKSFIQSCPDRKNYFYDEHHLNFQGSEQFTLEIKTRIENLLTN